MSGIDWFVFARIAGVMFRAPGFAHPAVPAVVRVSFAFMLALAVAPTIPPYHRVDAMAFVLVAAGEFALGSAIGLGATLLYDGAYYAGRLIDDYVGVRGGIPTATVTSSQGFARIWSALFLAGLFTLGGWKAIVTTLALSFTVVPPGAPIGDLGWGAYALGLVATIVGIAVAFALPALAAAALAQAASAIVMRLVPRLTSITLAAPFAFAAALVVMALGLPFVLEQAASAPIVLPWSAR